MKARSGLQLFTLAFSRWNDHDAPRLGAALAYYTLLSIAPLLIIVIAICALVFGQTSAEQRILAQARAAIGDSEANTLQALIKNVRHHGSGILASSIAVITLLFGASGLFMELRDSLNTIWDVPLSSSSAWRSLIWQRLIGFAMVLAVGFLLLVSVLLSAALGIIEQFFSNVVPIHPTVLMVVNGIVSTAAITVLFALIFKYVPEVALTWKDVIVGAAMTAILFTVGKFLLAWYLSTTSVGSAYGVAGSLVVLVVWVYYSAQIFLYGAVFTREYAEKFGTHTRRSKARQSSAKASGS